MNFSKIKKLSIGGVELKEFFINGVQVWKAGYKNWVPYSVTNDGKTIFNGTGYQEGKRLSSNGALKDQTGSVATGFIPAKRGDVIRMYGATWGTSAPDGYCYIQYYDANFNVIYSINKYREDMGADGNGVSNISPSSSVDKSASSVLTDDNGVTTFSLVTNDNKEYSYIRISATGSGAEMVVTINEPIE